MEELKSLLHNNVDGDKEGLQDHLLAILHKETEINSLITWIKVNSVAKNVSVDDVIKESIKISEKYWKISKQMSLNGDIFI